MVAQIDNTTDVCVIDRLKLSTDVTHLAASLLNWFVFLFTLSDAPKLATQPNDEERDDSFDDDDEIESVNQKAQNKRRPSGPKVKDPYAADDTSAMLLPVFGAIGAFIPLLYCLCKL